MVVNLGLVYKVQHHSGVFFQFVAFVRKRKRTVPDIIAAGGRYDHLVLQPSSVHISTAGTEITADIGASKPPKLERVLHAAVPPTH